MDNQLHVDNHYVPKLYLQNWTINGKLQVYNNLVSHKNVPLFLQKSPSAICYIKHFYTNHYKQEDCDTFEHWINNKIEIPYKRTQDKILNRIKLGYDDYQNLSRFVIAQYLRVPKFYVVNYRNIVNGLNSSFQDILKNELTKAYKKAKSKEVFTPLEKDNLIEEIPMNIDFLEKDRQNYLKVETLFGRKAWLSYIQRTVERTINKLPNYKWQIIKSIDGYHWYTSDNPVTLLNYWSKDRYDFNGIWKVKHTNIFMPISPEYLLFTEVGSRQPFVNTLDTQLFLNRCIIENSFLQVYSTTQDKLIPYTRPRVINSNEFIRIKEMLFYWHKNQSESEDEFFSVK